MITELLNRLLTHRNIVNCDRDIYLRRWYLVRTPWFAIFLHKFERSDEDRALHDHPWPFIVIPIWRGYIEHSSRIVIDDEFGIPTQAREPQTNRVYPILGTRFRPATYRHRVELFMEYTNTQSPWDAEGVMTPEPTGRELPSWSLFIRFKSCRDWGFWMPQGFVGWRDWWKDNCE